jgi:hypothetical protein
MEEIAAQYQPWNAMAQKIALVLWVISALIVIGHVVKLAVTSDAKTKYDYIKRTFSTAIPSVPIMSAPRLPSVLSIMDSSISLNILASSYGR